MNSFLITILLISISSLSFARRYSPHFIEKNEIQFIQNIKKTKEWKKCSADELSNLAKFICHNYIAYSLKTTKPCDKLDNDNNKTKCYGYVAFATKDFSLCEKFRYPNVCKNSNLRVILDPFDPKIEEKYPRVKTRKNRNDILFKLEEKRIMEKTKLKTGPKRNDQ